MSTKLDLHGVRHGDVQRKVDQFLGDHLQKRTNEVTIVIGNSDDMKRIVDTILEDYGLISEPTFMNNAVLNVKL